MGSSGGSIDSVDLDDSEGPVFSGSAGVVGATGGSKLYSGSGITELRSQYNSDWLLDLEPMPTTSYSWIMSRGGGPNL